MIGLSSPRIRTRLTAWYILVLAAVLLIYIGGTGCLVYWQLRSELDRHAVQDLETVEGLFFLDGQGQLRLNEDYHNHAESKQVLDHLLEVLSPAGKVLYRNELLGSRSLDGPPFTEEGLGGYSPRSARLSDGTAVRLVSRRHSFQGHPTIIRLAYTKQSLRARVEEFLAASLFALPPALLLAGLAGYALARRALIPVGRMTQQAEAITPDRLRERLPGEDVDDELGRLARVFNKTLARLEQSFEQLRRFTSDASHELRTPLASIRSIGEVGLRGGGDVERYREAIGSMLEEVNRLSRLVESLLDISRADSGHLRLQKVRCNAMELVKESAALVEVLAEEKGQQLTVNGNNELYIEADRLLLRQAVVNLLHNAIKFTPRGGSIAGKVSVSTPGRVAIEISDSGPGIASDHQTKVFDRFYRVDMARSRQDGGTGLGLSIVKWVMQAHDGSVEVVSTPGSGCVFRLDLPGVSILSYDSAKSQALFSGVREQPSADYE